MQHSMQEVDERLTEHKGDAEAMVAGVMQACQEVGRSALATLHSEMGIITAEVMISWHLSCCMDLLPAL